MQRPRQQVTHLDYLKGLCQLINALKKLRLDSLKSSQISRELNTIKFSLLEHHLPHGVCKGWALCRAKLQPPTPTNEEQASALFARLFISNFPSAARENRQYRPSS